MKRSWPSIVVGAILAAILILYMVSFQVPTTQVAVNRTFGEIKKDGVITKAGLYWKWPWPIQKVDKYDRRIQTASLIGEETTTRDGKTVVITTTVCWHIADPYTFAIRCKDMADAENKIRIRVQSDQKTIIGKYDFAQFVSTDPNELKYDAIEAELARTVEENTESLYGVNIDLVAFESFALPEKVTESVIDAMKKERQALAQQYTSEGESQARQIRDTAESIAGTIMAFADRKAKEIVAEGQQRAIRYNETFRKNEELATFLLKIENIPKILGDRATLILDQPMFTDLLRPASESTPVPSTQPAAGGVPTAALPSIIEPK